MSAESEFSPSRNTSSTQEKEELILESEPVELKFSSRVVELLISQWSYEAIVIDTNIENEECDSTDAAHSEVILKDATQQDVAIIRYNCVDSKQILVQLFAETQEEIEINLRILVTLLELIRDEAENNAKPSKGWLKRMEYYGMPVKLPVVINYRYQDYPDM